MEAICRWKHFYWKICQEKIWHTTRGAHNISFTLETCVPMTSLSHVAALNNEGVSLLLQHHHQDAVGIFLNALRLIKLLLASQGSKETFLDGEASPDLFHDATQAISGFQDHGCFVFSSAITLSEKVLARTSSSAREGALNDMSAVVLLNLALAYHHAGHQVHGSLLEKAERMYEKAIQLVGLNQNRRGTCLLVHVAAVNNLSQILQGRAEYPRSLEGFKYLASLLAGVGGVLRQQMCEQELYQGLLMNALLIAPPNTAAAA